MHLIPTHLPLCNIAHTTEWQLDKNINSVVWLAHCFSGRALDLAVSAWNSNRTKLIPWVGVAAPLSENTAATAIATATADLSLQQQQQQQQLQVQEASLALSAPEDSNNHNNSSSSSSSGLSLKLVGSGADVRNGRAFCFLQLPVSTGLPVHLNGFFELSSNRRDVWAPGGGMAGVGAARAEWNVALMREGVGMVYAQLLVVAAQQLGPCERLWR